MGDPSDLRFVPAPVANIPIDWTRVPEASKIYFLREWGNDWESDKVELERHLPTTIADFAKMFDETKFFGYFGPELCTLLMDISEFGLQASPDQVKTVGPRFYMKYTMQVWFLLFAPGTRDCIVGYSHDIPWTEYEDDDDDGGEKRRADEETELAEGFDISLEQDVLKGRAKFVDVTSKLGGWHASMVEEEMHSAQLGQAMLSLPGSHPARQAFFTMMFGR